MADPQSGGILGGITSLLSNPAVQQLLPAIAGGVGGFLAPRPGTGMRSRIGQGLLGTAQGYEQGQESIKNAAETQMLQAHAKQMQAAMKNQEAIKALLPQWAKDIPEDQRPMFNALMLSDKPGDQQQGFAWRMAEKSRPQTEQQLTSLNPKLTHEGMKGMTSLQLGDMLVKLSEAKAKDPTEFEQLKAAVHDANPNMSELEVSQKALEMKPEAALPAALAKMEQAQADRKEIVQLHVDNREPRQGPEPKVFENAAGKSIWVKPGEPIPEGFHEGKGAIGAGGPKPEHEGVPEKRAIDTITKMDAAFDKEYGGKPHLYGTTLRADATKEYDDARAAFYEKKGIDPNTGRPVAKASGGDSLPTLPSGWKWKDKDKRIAIDEKGNAHQWED